FAKALVSLPTPLPETHPLQASTKDALALVEAIARAHPVPSAAGLRSQLLRRFGRFEEAIDAARHAARSEPCSTNEVFLALALRDGGHPDQALEAYERALAHEPTNASVHLDMGDLLLRLERWNEAALHYADALAIEPRNEWAEASLLYARLRSGPPKGLLAKLRGTHDPSAWRARLEKLAPANTRAAWALAELEPPEPYVNWLPGPGDAIVNAARKCLLEKAARPIDRILNVTVSALEAPSAV